MFYADTAMFGGRSGLLSALDFFGPEHLLFATDAPLGPVPETVGALDRLGLPAAERAAVLAGNARRLWSSTASKFAGRQPYYEPAAGNTRLLVGPFASSAEASRACAAIRPAPCVPMKR